ncbi:MAG: DUF5694 domain-containing protein [Sphingomicrobium sp.]
MGWIVAVGALLAAGGAQAETRIAPVEVMVVGTYHFDNPGLDIYNAKADDVLKSARQAELSRVSAALAEFRPTKIMVERIVKSPGLSDPKYATFTSADLATNRDERVQIAYRLANRTGAAVFGIDEQPDEGEPDYFPFDAVAGWANDNGKKQQLDAMMAGGAAIASKLEQDQKTMSIGAMLAERNDPAVVERDQQLYYGALALGGIDQQPGAVLNAMWYMRNAKIFAKLQTVAQPGDRIVIVYGSGHNYWLRHFARTVPGYQLVESSPYLRRVAR